MERKNKIKFTINDLDIPALLETKATELIDIYTSFHILQTDSTLSLEQALTKHLLQNSIIKVILATIISVVGESSRIRT